MALCSPFVEVRVNRRIKLTGEGINPIAWFAEEAVFVALVIAGHGSGVFGHVRRFKCFAVIKNGRIVAAVEISIGLDKEMIGKDTPAVAEQSLKQIARTSAVALPRLKPHAQASSQAETKNEEGGQDQQWY